MKKLYIAFISLGLLSGTAYATEGATSSTEQTQQSTSSSSEEEKEVKMGSIRISGFSRLVGFYRDMKEYYSPDQGARPLKGLTLPITLAIGDGSGNPAFMLRLEGSAGKNTSILLETGLHTTFAGWSSGVYSPQAFNGLESKTGRIATVFARFALEAKTVTDLGTFKLMAGGGQNWGKLSPFTLWNFQYRDDMFERYPWDPAGSNWKRYNFYYSLGDIPRDARWGNRSIQGFRIDAEDLPYGLDGSFIYGRTIGIWESYLRQFPQQTFAGRLNKNIKGKKVGINVFHQFGFAANANNIDTLRPGSTAQLYSAIGNDGNTTQYLPGATETYLVKNLNKTSQLILTGDLKWNIAGKVRLYSELGVGSYRDRFYFGEDAIKDFKAINTGTVNEIKKRLWSPIFYTEARFNRSFIGFPFRVSVFHVGRHAVNNSGAILNSSIESATNGLNLVGAAAVNNTFYIEGMVTEIGQITNNRQGVTLNATKKVKNFVFDLGLSAQQEIVNLGIPDTLGSGLILNGGRGPSGNPNGVRNSVTFYHIVNQYQRSRFEYANRFYGPYSRLQPDFRRTWENIAITDQAKDINYKKSFSTLDFQVKYKTKLFKKDIILSAFGRANSVQENISPIPVFTDKAFLRQWYEEFMFFYSLAPKVTVIGLVSFEQAKGNNRTELADSKGVAIKTAQGLPAGPGQIASHDGGLVRVNEDDATFGRVDGKPIDQTGMGLGLGVDYDFVDNASLNLRYRWIQHEDKVFIQDKFSGHDVTLELKVFF